MKFILSDRFTSEVVTDQSHARSYLGFVRSHAHLKLAFVWLLQSPQKALLECEL